jgi:hypothetical protein
MSYSHGSLTGAGLLVRINSFSGDSGYLGSRKPPSQSLSTTHMRRTVRCECRERASLNGIAKVAVIQSQMCRHPSGIRVHAGNAKRYSRNRSSTRHSKASVILAASSCRIQAKRFCVLVTWRHPARSVVFDAIKAIFWGDRLVAFNLIIGFLFRIVLTVGTIPSAA